jgi:hypothetical protein
MAKCSRYNNMLIKFVSDLPPHNWNIVESGVKHQNPNPKPLDSFIETCTKMMGTASGNCIKYLGTFPNNHVTIYERFQSTMNEWMNEWIL